MNRSNAMSLTAIDLFAGLGGFTEAAESIGVEVVWAGNHWAAAVECHRANHPGVTHVCQDLHQADWEAVPRHNLLLASPCCQGHSKARGKDRPHSDRSRSTAWAVVSCAEFHRPTAVIVENVPEFADWALFPAWRLAMESLGYSLSLNVFDAARAGTPQNRERLFVVGTRSKSALVVRPPTGDLMPAGPVIDWAGGKWSPVEKKGRAAATLRRVAAGRKELGERFAVSYYGSTRGGRSIDRPIGTITTRDRWAVIDGGRMRMLSAAECRAFMGFRPDYRIPSQHKLAVHMLGNSVPPPLAAYVIGEVKRAA